MPVQTRVIAIRYAYRTEEHEDGPGTDGFVVIQEVDGTRHAAIIFPDTFGTEMLETMFRYPGEPHMCHEMFATVLASIGALVTSLEMRDETKDVTRLGLVTYRLGEREWTKECGLFDLVGLSIATGVLISIKAELFAEMHASAPSLDWILSDDVRRSERAKAEYIALSDDPSIGKA